MMRVKSAANYLGCSVPTLYRRMAKHGLPAHRLGGYWAFYRSELDAWVKSQPAINLPSAK
jgi:excisionase family DNA binding protein